MLTADFPRRRKASPASYAYPAPGGPTWWWENSLHPNAEAYSDTELWQPYRDPAAPAGRFGAHPVSVAPGDRVLRFADRETCAAIGIVQGPAVYGPAPGATGTALERAAWGYSIPIQPIPLTGQITLRDIPKVWRVFTGKPFSLQGAVTKAHLCPLPAPFVSWLLATFPERIPAEALPPPPLPDTHTAVWFQMYRESLERLYPDPAMRRVCLVTLADAIAIAHERSPACWTAAMLEPGLFRMNVGKIEVCVFRRDGLYLVLDREALSPAERDALEFAFSDWPETGAQYQSAPYARGASFFAHAADRDLPRALAAFHSVIRRAAGPAGRTPYAHVHQPYLVEYLREELGRDLPQPDFTFRLPKKTARPKPVPPEPDPAWLSGDWRPAWLFDVPLAVGELSDLLAGRRAGDGGIWPVTRFRQQLKAGQPVILWQGGPDAGVYATGELDDAPFERAPGDWAVPVTYTTVLSEPILAETLRTQPHLRELADAPQPDHAICEVPAAQWAALQPLLPSCRR
ncbi:MAG: hypothetical protein QM692_13320 [Thermomicrobiales bacterium]